MRAIKSIVIISSLFFLPRLNAFPLPGDKTVFYQSFEWSHDSKTICFAAIVLDSGKYVKGKWEIYTINKDGRELKKLTNNLFTDEWPSFSPDGKKIVFQSDRDGNPEIYIMDVDGSNTVRITKDPARDNYPSWSPDGKKILFVSDRDGNNELYLMNLDGTQQTRLTISEHKEYNPEWSPDGKKIVYYYEKGDHKDQVYVAGADGKNPVNITNDTLNNIYPAWTHDGRKIIYCSALKDEGNLCSINSDGSGDKKNLFKEPYFARYSPDGKNLGYITGDWPESAIYISNADGTEKKLINDKMAIAEFDK